MSALLRFCRLFGLHPLVGFGMFAVDSMLFAAEIGLDLWLLSCIVAAALVVPCVLIQRYGMPEGWGLAVGKSLLVGVLTAIPTPLPSVVPRRATANPRPCGAGRQ